MAGQRGRLGGDALLQVAVAGDREDEVVEGRLALRGPPGRTGRARSGRPSPCPRRWRRPGPAGRWSSRRRRCGRTRGVPASSSPRCGTPSGRPAPARSRPGTAGCRASGTSGRRTGRSGRVRSSRGPPGRAASPSGRGCTRPAPGSSPYRDGRCRPSVRHRRPGRGRCRRPAGRARSTRGLWWSAWCSPWVRAPLHMSRMSNAGALRRPPAVVEPTPVRTCIFSSHYRLPGSFALRLPTGVFPVQQVNTEPLVRVLNRVLAGSSAGVVQHDPTPANIGVWATSTVAWYARAFTGSSHPRACWDVSVRGVRDGRRIPSIGDRRGEPKPERAAVRGPGQGVRGADEAADHRTAADHHRSGDVPGAAGRSGSRARAPHLPRRLPVRGRRERAEHVHRPRHRRADGPHLAAAAGHRDGQPA